MISSLMTTTQMAVKKFVYSPFKDLTWLLPQELSKFQVHFHIILESQATFHKYSVSFISQANCLYIFPFLTDDLHVLPISSPV